jgi:uncharacterized repeat protein (TIGR03943 family)
VTRTSSGVLLTLVGVLALRAGLTDAMLQFLRPGMRPWLIAAASIVCLLGVVQVVTGRRDGVLDHNGDGHGDDQPGHSHNLRVGWLLVAPLCVGLLAPAALDAYSAQRSVTFSQRSWDLGKFDVNKLLSAEAIAGGTPKLALVDYLGATTNAKSRDVLATHPVNLEGFVLRAGHGFFLTRFFIGCCAADAIPLKLYVQTSKPLPPDNQWVRATVTLDRDRTTVASTAHAQATLDSLENEKKPSEPYEYP